MGLPLTLIYNKLLQLAKVSFDINAILFQSAINQCNMHSPPNEDSVRTDTWLLEMSAAYKLLKNEREKSFSELFRQDR